MFCESLYRSKAIGKIPVIVDFKAVSPKEGNLFSGRDPAETAKKLERLGAPALSVVTESVEFGGSLSLLETISGSVNIPVLRKDFIKNKKDLRQTVDCGAKAVLLICACMEKHVLFELYEESLALGLMPLVEAHTKEELELACFLKAKLVGINNRNILELEKDRGSVERTQNLAAFAPRDSLLISESGIKTPVQAAAAVKAGADAVLVGTALWKAKNIEDAYMKFSRGAS